MCNNMEQRTRRINVDVDEKLVRQIAATFEATAANEKEHDKNILLLGGRARSLKCVFR